MLDKKYDKLLKQLKSFKSVLIAFSGGVDSTFLLFSCLKSLPATKVVPVIIKSQFIPASEFEEAKLIAAQNNISLVVINLDMLKSEEITANSTDRCYLCKNKLFSLLKNEASKRNIKWVVEGSNIDDTLDYRPGMKALEELNIRSPLKDAGFTKAEIRQLSKKYNLPTWNKPALACLASRIPYGEKITQKKLTQIERAEKILLSHGFSNVRVRHHGSIARIELLPNEFNSISNENIRLDIYSQLKNLGFKYIAVDLIGYRQGSLNEII